MADVPVYAIVNLHNTHAPTYSQYEKGFFPLLKTYGGEFVTYDDKGMCVDARTRAGGRGAMPENSLQCAGRVTDGCRLSPRR